MFSKGITSRSKDIIVNEIMYYEEVFMNRHDIPHNDVIQVCKQEGE